MKLKFINITNFGLILLGGGYAVNVSFSSQPIPLWILGVGGGLIVIGTLLHMFYKN